ncbi:MAG: DUF421 domain-containing protein [Firmicutes bacterium]|nr:DUF421 domain-containing protein [Bacillota bacterium]
MRADGRRRPPSAAAVRRRRGIKRGGGAKAKQRRAAPPLSRKGGIDLAILFIRCLLLYALVLGAMKLMGKRQLGQLQPFELVAILIISEMASLSMQSNSIPLLYSVTPILTISLLQILVSLINLKSQRLRDLICGKPDALIARGRLQERTLARLRLNLNDVEEMCRAKGFFDLSAVDWAIMETNGQLSVLPRQEDGRPGELSRLLILDGRVNREELRQAGYDRRWLGERLAERGLRPEQVFAAGIDGEGRFFAQAREDRS